MGTVAQLNLNLGSKPKQAVFPVGKRIAAGVKILESLVGPNWRDRINRKVIIRSFNHCMTCQVSGGNYLDGCRMLGLDPYSQEPALHGFNALDIHSERAEQEFEALSEGWRLVIENPRISNIKCLKIAA